MESLVKQKQFNFHERVGCYPVDWQLTEVKELGDLFSGSTPSTTEESYWGGENIWLTPSDLTAIPESENYIYKGEANITDKGVKSCSTVKIPSGAICLSSRATIGDCAIAGVDLYTNQGFVNIVCNEKLHPFYFLYWIKQNKNYISRYAAGTTFLEISRRTFGKLKIALPDYDEQKAIASILSKVDEAIKATDNSVKAMEKLKKGLMQNLLTGKLKHDGSWRKDDEFYKDEKFGNVPLGWVLKKGNKITDKITKGQSPKWQGFEYQTSGVLFVTSENVLDGFIDVSSPKYLPMEFNDKIKNSQLLKGDILINIVGASIGRCAVYNLDTEFANTNQAVCVFRLNDENDNDFIAYYIQLEHTQRRLLGNSVETARANLSLGDFRKFKFIIPEDKGEQILIANKIKEINDIYIAKHQKIKTLQRLKQSLMQNLLTGKLRVDIAKVESALQLETC